jgi:hypothetical protein
VPVDVLWVQAFGLVKWGGYIGERSVGIICLAKNASVRTREGKTDFNDEGTECENNRKVDFIVAIVVSPKPTSQQAYHWCHGYHYYKT